jgi:asparagine synthase (glutamine-hydrolysing)
LQLSAGIGCGELLDGKGALEATAPCFWSGISLDDLLGGGALGYGYDPDNAKWSFEVYEQKAFRWGLTPAQVAPLVAASDGPEIVAAVRQAFRRDFQACDDAAYRLVYRARLQNRHRYHLGNTVWQLSFASWPLLFVADRQWLETMFDLPPAMSMYKGVELELLRCKYPQLLSVPLDVNSWHYGWANPTRLHRLRQRLNKIVPIERWWNDGYWRRWRGIERRRYWRFYDFDGPKWQAVRQYAEPLRNRLNAWFNSEEVARLVPPPQEKLPKNNAFGDAAARRNLLGAAIWSAEYF